MTAESESVEMRPRLLAWGIRYLLPRVWYLHPPGELLIQAPFEVCLETMMTAAKPSVQRLHLGNIFAGGRRYHIQATPGGFRIVTTHKVFWHQRRRTKPTAILSGRFEPIGTDHDLTRIELDVRIRTGYLLDFLLLPAFMTSILIYVPWNPTLVTVAIVLLFTLSWFGHRYNAMMEAHAMVWFVKKSLADFVPVRFMALEGDNTNVLYDNRDFEEAWQKFYRRHGME
jgi:hypothetical protein